MQPGEVEEVEEVVVMECDLPTPRVQAGTRAKAGAELPTELGDPSVHRSSPDTLQPLTAALCQRVCVCVCVCVCV